MCVYVSTGTTDLRNTNSYGRVRNTERNTSHSVRTAVRNTEDERVSLERPGRTERGGALDRPA